MHDADTYVAAVRKGRGVLSVTVRCAELKLELLCVT